MKSVYAKEETLMKMMPDSSTREYYHQNYSPMADGSVSSYCIRQEKSITVIKRKK